MDQSRHPEVSALAALSGITLDDLLSELRERAGAVTRSQERLGALLDAVVAITADLDLPAVLERITLTACQLAEARYGALGVLGDDGGLSEFITHGISAEERASIGPLPHGHGVLGLLINKPESIRMPDIGKHPTSYGFPPNHPEMHTFLGVPIRIRDQVFGNLYLAEKQGGGQFTAGDQDIVVALAAAAGIAIENARLYEQSQSRERWLNAAAEVKQVALDDGSRSRLHTAIAHCAQVAARSQLAAILVDDSPGCTIATARGEHSRALQGIHIDTSIRALIAQVADKPLIRTAAGALAGELPFLPEEITSVALAPLGVGEELSSLLLVGWSQTSDRGGHRTEGQLLGVFGEQAALALEFTRARADRATLAVFEDRDRIARDLHDSVIQRLFAIGLSLQAISRRTHDTDLGLRLVTSIDDLDDTIKDVRRTIYSLNSRADGDDLANRIDAVTATATTTLGFAPSLLTDGPLAAVSADTALDVLAVLREALANVARHANASTVSIELRVAQQPGGSVELVVTDDGKGISQTGRRSGLANLAQRAGQLGGHFEVGSGPDGGTVVSWTVPVDSI